MQSKAEEKAWKKYRDMKQEQDIKIQKLKQEQEDHLKNAELIEANIKDVQAIIEILKQMVEGGLPWDAICKMINESKKEENPLSQFIGDMDLGQDKINVILYEQNVQIDIKLSAYQNARQYYDLKKTKETEEQKIIDAMQIQLKKAEQSAQKEIEKEKNKVQKVQNARKKLWFEKFYWFISTDGYLVISGKDAIQNTVLLQKYLEPEDLYFYADIAGSPSTIIKTNKQHIPDKTLIQAGTFSVCRTRTWDQKNIVQSWWVYGNQISQLDKDGQKLPDGQFLVVGKKNIIIPPRLELGCSLIYQLDEESFKRHEQERMKQVIEEEEQQQDEPEQNEIENPQEKNMFDSDEDEAQEQNDSQAKTYMDAGKEVTLLDFIIKNDGISKKAQKQASHQEFLKRQEEKHKQQQIQEQLLQQQQKQEKSKKNKNIKQHVQSSSEEEDKKPKQKGVQQNQNQSQQQKKQKQKQKKIQEKYADQSDEEREIKMKLMGAGNKKIEQKDLELLVKPKKVSDQKEHKKKEKHNQHQEQEKQIDENKDIKQETHEEPKNDSKQNDQQKIDEQKQNIDQPQKTVDQLEQNNNQQQELQKNDDQQEQQKEQQPKPERIKKPKVPKEDPYNEVVDLLDVPKLVSYLYPDDRYQNIIPMVGPYQTFNNINKIRVKIKPGNLKKGKASNQIFGHFASIKEIPKFEQQMISMILEEDIQNQLPNGMKIIEASIVKKQKEKQHKKPQKQNK
ncbi:hypothetical protein pb186bvf_010117 [Paramecium bursaria]